MDILTLLLSNSLVEWTSVFETVVPCLLVSKFSNFYTVQYGKVQYSTGIYLERPVMSCNACKISSQSTVFPSFNLLLFIQYSTEECSSVQYKAAGPVRAVISIRYGSKEGVQGSLLVP